MMADSVPHIGIDAMGGDHGPQAVVDGVVLAQRQMPGRFCVTLVGDEPEIRAALCHARAESGLPVEVVHAAERIEMSEKAASAARRKSGSSLGVLTQLAARVAVTTPGSLPLDWMPTRAGPNVTMLPVPAGKVA